MREAVLLIAHGTVDDLAALARALDDGSDRPRLVVSDEVFSMAGDEADMPSVPADSDVLAASATLENSSRICCCCSRVIKVNRAISRETASTSRG